MNKELIEQFEQSRFQALLDQDYELFKHLCDPDLTYVHSSGKVDNLNQYFEKLKNNYYEYLKIDYKINKVQIFDELVLVYAHFNAELLIQKQPATLNNLILAVLKRNGDELKLLASQPTPIK
nr:nuclear transport factor 2 family protein [Acinetobacter sp. Marseille-Q1620]